MARDFTNAKCFIRMNGRYEEITYGELLRRCDEDEANKLRKFIPLYGMLMEVSTDEYKDFYRKRRRLKYLDEQSAENGDVSIDAHITEDLYGKSVLVNPAPDVANQVEMNILLDKLRYCRSLLAEDEQELLHWHYDLNITETDLAKLYHVHQSTISRRLKQIVVKLRELIDS